MGIFFSLRTRAGTKKIFRQRQGRTALSFVHQNNVCCSQRTGAHGEQRLSDTFSSPLSPFAAGAAMDLDSLFINHHTHTHSLTPPRRLVDFGRGRDHHVIGKFFVFTASHRKPEPVMFSWRDSKEKKKEKTDHALLHGSVLTT